MKKEFIRMKVDARAGEETASVGETTGVAKEDDTKT